MSELKMCPFCGEPPYLSPVSGTLRCISSLCQCMDSDAWKRRPIEEALELELAPFRDPYFNGLDTAAIAELAKKSLRLSSTHCDDMQRIAELEAIVARQAARPLGAGEICRGSNRLCDQPTRRNTLCAGHS